MINGPEYFSITVEAVEDDSSRMIIAYSHGEDVESLADGA